MADRTYIELCKNDKRTIQLDIRTSTGVEVVPSAAYYMVNGSLKDNTIVSKSPATVNGNKVSAQITTTVTASAAQYDLYWEIRQSGGDVKNHCTKILVVDTC